MPQTPHEAYTAGKTRKEIEYGTQYPDGTILWRTGQPGPDLSTSAGRQLEQERYDEECRRIHVPVGTLVFVRRTKTTKFTEPESVV
jgi:hypothetical protein